MKRKRRTQRWQMSFEASINSYCQSKWWWRLCFWTRCSPLCISGKWQSRTNTEHSMTKGSSTYIKPWRSVEIRACVKLRSRKNRRKREFTLPSSSSPTALLLSLSTLLTHLHGYRTLSSSLEPGSSILLSFFVSQTRECAGCTGSKANIEQRTLLGEQEKSRELLPSSASVAESIELYLFSSLQVVCYS